MQLQALVDALKADNWLFAGSLRAGQRSAAVMSLIQSARLNGHDPYAYLQDELVYASTAKAVLMQNRVPQGHFLHIHHICPWINGYSMPSSRWRSQVLHP